MKFLELLEGVELAGSGVHCQNAGNPEITGIAYDSRRVGPGSLFVAMRGETSDGNRFVDQAIGAGAVAVVTDSDLATTGVAWARVAHGRQALATLSANFYGQPANQLGITGITGTNGKSTTAFLIEAILGAAGRGGALVGTIEYHIGKKVLPAPHTTPESLDMQRLFCETVASGGSEVVMEVSSHALAQGRTHGIFFDVAVFTNLTRDHLDYHKSMEEYFQAKKILFAGSGRPAPRTAVLNADDSYGANLAAFARGQGSQVSTYGWSKADFHARDVAMTARGTQFRLICPQGSIKISSPLIGRVNVYNILAASAAALGRGCSLESVAQGVRTLKAVPGRFERVDCGQPFTVVVDYAHTDDALRNLTSLAGEFVKQNSGRVITVFGCGGDRDRSKRPLMGEAAGQGSDFVVLTSDNPRSEDPLAIINDAVIGLQRSGARYRTEPNRRAAIALAIGEARAGDIVLIAGKGHEKVQITPAGAIPFDDREVAADVLRKLGYENPSNQEGTA
jgi:UDP-N-acetylmuramoyl-L-alanyl-D-glutamate--2,6-diaminopimelate ligase